MKNFKKGLTVVALTIFSMLIALVFIEWAATITVH